MNSLQKTNSSELSQWEDPKSLQERVGRMLEIQQNVMKKDIDYGTIPGTNKPTLYKPGAEILMVTFLLADKPVIEDLSDVNEGPNGVKTYRITTEMYSQSGVYLGYGVGECSSNEEKYAWRKAVCNEEFEDTEMHLKRKKWIKPYNKDPFQVFQIRTNPADIANTILKMAKKRSKMDAVLSVTGGSRIYTQDLEDFSDEMRDMVNSADKPRGSTKPDFNQKTTAKASSKKGEISDEERKKNKWLSVKQVGLLRGKCKGSGMDVEQLKLYLLHKRNITCLDHISWADKGVEKMIKFIEDPKQIKIVNDFKAPEPIIDTPPEEVVPETAMDHEDFKKHINGLAEIAKVSDIDLVLGFEFAIACLDEVPSDMQEKVIEHFVNMGKEANKK